MGKRIVWDYKSNADTTIHYNLKKVSMKRDKCNRLEVHGHMVLYLSIENTELYFYILNY